LYVPLLGLTGFLLNQLLLGTLLSGLVFTALGASIPVLILQRMRRQRAKRFSEQLPDALDLIEAALRAGHGLVSAFGVVAEEFPSPIADELREVGEEVRVGLPLRNALENLIDRIDDPDLPILVVGILVAEESGGNLAEVLENVAHTIRERFKLLRDVRVLTAQGRFSGVVLTSLPFVVGVALFSLNYKYFSPMVETASGHQLLLYAFLSVLCGHLMIRRIVQMPV
jgi:tight adherence protein B